MRKAAIAVGAAAAAIAGCGSSAPSQVSATAKAFLAAIARGDGAAACAALTPAAAAQLERSLSLPCAEALSGLAPDAKERRALEHASLDVSATRGSATVTYPSVSAGGAPRTLTLEKSGGRWRISALPASG